MEYNPQGSGKGQKIIIKVKKRWCFYSEIYKCNLTQKSTYIKLTMKQKKEDVFNIDPIILLIMLVYRR